MTRHIAQLLILVVLLAGPAVAKPLPYSLDNQTSEVGFTISMGGMILKGLMPVTRADLLLDFDRAANSKASVTLNASAARMGLPFAAETMRGPTILDTAHFPNITFTSTRVRVQGTGQGQGAVIDGRITIRGVTRPIRLQAQFYRPVGSDKGARRDLSIRLTGQISRSAFGASGSADLVGDVVSLDILAHIHADAIP